MKSAGAPMVCILCRYRELDKISLNRSLGVNILECRQCGFVQSEYVSDAALQEYYMQYYRAPLSHGEIDMLREETRAQAEAQISYLESLIPVNRIETALDYGAADGELGKALNAKICSSKMKTYLKC